MNEEFMEGEEIEYVGERDSCPNCGGGILEHESGVHKETEPGEYCAYEFKCVDCGLITVSFYNYSRTEILHGPREEEE